MKNTTKEPRTKITKNRITALILALLLALTALSPTLPVKAQDTTPRSTDATENNNRSGTSAGAGDNLPTDNGNDDVNASFSHTINFEYGGEARQWIYLASAVGDGHFVVRTIKKVYDKGTDNERYAFSFGLFSEKPFTVKITDYVQANGIFQNGSTNEYNRDKIDNFGNLDCYYYYTPTYTVYKEKKSNRAVYKSISSPNVLEYDMNNHDDNSVYNSVAKTIDLSKDDYISEDKIANMTPVRDPSIGYLPRARYFDDRKSASSSHNVTATIQWDSFQEPYATDLENPYYVEIYAKCYYEKLGENITHSKYKYKKYGDVKYVSERCVFPDDEPCLNYLSTINVPLSDLVYGISFPHLYNYGISEYYVRLVHYDNEKQQLLCGGFTKLTLDGHGGSTSSEGDFTDDGDWENDPDGGGDTGWGDDGDIKPITPDPGNPDFTIDDSNVFTLLYSLVKSASNFISGSITLFLNAFKTIISSVGEFPALFKSLFSFLPNEIVYLMLAGVAAVIVMRFLGR